MTNSIKNLFARRVIVSLILVTLTSCLSPRGSMEFFPTSTAVQSMTPPPEDITDTIINSTKTPMVPTSSPVVNLTPSFIPTSTVVFPTSMSSFTPIATLSIEEEGAFLSELMSNNGGCELPCWWGITPGETTEQSAQNQFVRWGIDQWYPSGSYRLVGLGYAYPNSSYYIPETAVKFWVDKRIVEFIHVSVQHPTQGVEMEFYRDWQYFQVDKILNRFGLPNYLGLNAGIPEAGVKSYILHFFYPNHGIEISYVIESELLDNGQRQICFEFSKYKFITLNLYQPGRLDNIPEQIIPNHLENYTSLEEVTGLTIEGFYELYHSADDTPCLLVN